MASTSSESTCASNSTAITAYIGNLRSDCSVKQLENEIQSLFHTVGVSVADEEVKAHRKAAKKPAYAFVNLQDKSVFDFVVEKLNGLPCASRKELIFPGAKLEISVARKKLQNDDSKDFSTRSKKTRKLSKKSKHKTSTGNCDAGNYPPETIFAVVGKGSGSMATSSVTIATSTTTLATSYATMDTNMLNGSEFVILDPSKRHYFLGQKLRTEDRLTEYKQGGGNYLDFRFKVHLAKYVCAFLNSEGGTLLVGVHDNCTVCGIKISTKREDLLRQEIDQIMKGFNPPVFTSSYSITFVPVYTSPMPVSKTSNQCTNSQDVNHALPIVNSKKINANSADINDGSLLPITKNENHNCDIVDQICTSSVTTANAQEDGSNLLDMDNIPAVSTINDNSQNSPDKTCTSSLLTTEDNVNNSSSFSDVILRHTSSPKPSSSKNIKEKEKFVSMSKKLPPLKASLPPSLLSNADVLNKPEYGKGDVLNTTSFGKKNYLENEMTISDGLKAIKTELKVIEIKVHASYGEDSSTLYETNKGEVYIRRDGSIQGPLKASQILAWSRQNLNKSHHLERTHLKQEIDRKQDEIEMNMKLVNELVKQKQFLEEQYQEKIEKLKEKEDKLNAEISVLRSQEAQMHDGNDIQKNRSKVCVIL